MICQHNTISILSSIFSQVANIASYTIRLGFLNSDLPPLLPVAPPKYNGFFYITVPHFSQLKTKKRFRCLQNSSSQHSFYILEDCIVDMQDFVRPGGRERSNICNAQPLGDVACPGTGSSETGTGMCKFVKHKVLHFTDCVSG